MSFSTPKSATITQGHTTPYRPPAVFIVQLLDDGVVATLSAPTAAEAVGLVCACHGCQGPIRNGWYLCDEGWSMDLYDWCECSGPEDPRPIAHITAPPGFLPPPDAPLQEMERQRSRG